MGGVEKVFLNIASVANNKEIFLLPIHKNYDSEFINQIPKNVKIIDNDSFHIKGTVAPFNLIKLAKFVNKKFKHNYKDLCCINFSDTISTVILSLLVKAKLHYSWCHCNPLAFKNSKFFLLYKILFRKFNLIVSLCYTQKKVFCDVFGNYFDNKSKICFNLTDINDIQKKAKENLNIDYKYIVHVSRFDCRSKDFYTLIDAYNLLPKNLRSNIKLLLVGDGSDRKKIENYVELKELKNSVVFAGMQKNPYKYIVNAECFVLSSKTEGFPLVICEALSCECPVVSSDCVAGPRDILQNGKYGLLFEVGNSKELESCMEKVLTDNELRTKLKKSAVQRVKEINKSAVVAINEILR